MTNFWTICYMDVLEAKAALRTVAQERRRKAAAEAGQESAARLADNLAAHCTNLSGLVASGYLSIGSEIDVVPTLQLLGQFGLVTALLVVVGRDRPLVFRRWTPDMDLERGPFKTRHPSSINPDIIPDLVIVPMLAFDSNGYRIGWGGGFYDRTLMKLRSVKPIIAVGAAFSVQQVDNVPRDHHDARLDWVATEIGVIEMAIF